MIICLIIENIFLITLILFEIFLLEIILYSPIVFINNENQVNNIENCIVVSKVIWTENWQNQINNFQKKNKINNDLILKYILQYKFIDRTFQNQKNEIDNSNDAINKYKDTIPVIGERIYI